MIIKLLLLIWGHALADYPLQGDFLARAKNPAAPIPGVPWVQALAAHAAIHAGFVLVFTGSIILTVAEFIAHAVTDYAKCRGWIGFNADQAIHVGCKVLWVILLSAGLTACATGGRPAPQRATETVTVTLPGALRSCVPKDLKDPPEYPDTDEALRAAPDAADRYALLAAGRPLRVARAGEVEPIIKGCR